MKSCESNCIERLRLRSMTLEINHKILGENWVLTSEKMDLTAKVDELTIENLYLKQELARFKKAIFGSKSERFVSCDEQFPQQLSLELSLPEPLPTVPQRETITYEREKPTEEKKIIPFRGAFPADLPRVEVIVEPEVIPVGATRIGEEISDQLEFNPGTIYVKSTIRPKYVLPKQQGETESKIIIAELPSQPIPKGIAWPGLLAYVLVSKFTDHLPLNRLIQIMKRMGIELSESTLVDWVRQCCKLLLPLYELMKKEVLNCDYIQADESPLQVQTRDRPGASHKGYLWGYRAVVKMIIVFLYEKSRSREGPKKFLKDFKGTIQADGYTGYDCFDETEHTTLICCMAHVRRKFKEALDNDKVRAEYALSKIRELYMIERYARENKYTEEQIKTLRQEQSLPIMREFERWLIENKVQVMPKSSIGKAISHTLRLWNRLKRYLDNGKYLIDNNLIEQQMRPIALGRNNYMFAGSHNGAQWIAMMYSFFNTCKMHNIEPYAWMKEVLTRIPDHKANRLHELLPIPGNGFATTEKKQIA